MNHGNCQLLTIVTTQGNESVTRSTDGTGNNSDAADGTCVVFTLTNTHGATASFTTPTDGDNCGSAVGNLDDCQTSSGSCSVTITSSTTRLTENDATTRQPMGERLHRVFQREVA